MAQGLKCQCVIPQLAIDIATCLFVVFFLADVLMHFMLS